MKLVNSSRCCNGLQLHATQFLIALLLDGYPLGHVVATLPVSVVLMTGARSGHASSVSNDWGT